MPDLAKWLAGGVAIATAVLGFLGVTGGNVERLLRNYEVQFPLAVALLLVAVALGAITPALSMSNGGKVALLVVGTALFVGDLVWLASLAARSEASRELPHIEVALEDGDAGPVLNGSVTASGLKVKESVAIQVWGTSSDQELASDHLGVVRNRKDRPAGKPGLYTQLLYGTRAGPGPDGTVSHTFKMSILPGMYDELNVYAELNTRSGTRDGLRCESQAGNLGCVTLRMRPPPALPRLGATWKDASTAAFTVRMDGVPVGGVVLVEVRGERRGRPTGAIYASRLEPDSKGVIDEKIELPVGGRSALCAIARPGRSNALPRRIRASSCRRTARGAAFARLRK